MAHLLIRAQGTAGQPSWEKLFSLVAHIPKREAKQKLVKLMGTFVKYSVLINCHTRVSLVGRILQGLES